MNPTAPDITAFGKESPLIHYAGISEVAEALGKTPAAVRQQLARGTCKIRPIGFFSKKRDRVFDPAEVAKLSAQNHGLPK